MTPDQHDIRGGRLRQEPVAEPVPLERRGDRARAIHVRVLELGQLFAELRHLAGGPAPVWYAMTAAWREMPSRSMSGTITGMVSTACPLVLLTGMCSRICTGTISTAS